MELESPLLDLRGLWLTSFGPSEAGVPDAKRVEGALLEVTSPRPCVLEATSIMSGATPGILQDRFLTGRCPTGTRRPAAAFGHMISSMVCSTWYPVIWRGIAMDGGEMELDVSSHSSFPQSHRAVFKLRRDGWVDGSCRTSLL